MPWWIVAFIRISVFFLPFFSFFPSKPCVVDSSCQWEGVLFYLFLPTYAKA